MSYIAIRIYIGQQFYFKDGGVTGHACMQAFSGILHAIQSISHTYGYNMIMTIQDKQQFIVIIVGIFIHYIATIMFVN